ncbi:UDP-4-amino-4,6-dideoxy-N-acetyl-beta-L-altrosamine transaminase [Niveibacterium sp.]|uniref:UDP-4-amino-4, 6-dideoxy-N-acetyl-beta-L-altrosamine transaminase n=1 Tax=Niveibacterium sp. TaxID=2017444 RepID=UPI0035B3CDD4
MFRIPYGRQEVTDGDIAAVVEVMRSNWLTQGPAVPLFESRLASYVGAQFAVATNSATSALHVACVALGLSAGKRLWTVPNTFVASANCGRYCGAEVGFVDIDPDTYCLDPVALRMKLLSAQAAGTLPDVVVAVDFAGQPCDLDALLELKNEFGFRLIEDASHAVGASYGVHRVGAVPGVDVTIFSFHPVKIITSGEGGMLVTNDAELAATAQRLRTHGIQRPGDPLLDCTQGAWYYEQQTLGWNYRMIDLEAALGESQLRRIDHILARRRALAERYVELLRDLPVTLPHQRSGRLSSYHLYPVLFSDAAKRRKVFDGMRAAGIGVQVHYMPVHLQPYYRARGNDVGDFPVAENYSSRTLSLPLFPTLTDDEQVEVVDTMRGLLK